ncbi:hypothetical protein BDV96DRAFT_591421 [Lophiotrema nucula]|uniref:Uncharacterized protein n=1 Tax=Lophiotrema nucula TaxID=690887 RepID=A0A6A5YGZ9_9PLEO|nr:hypothetical protein BDV96DRAFT_591421 [Lophiotrema nucula]
MRASFDLLFLAFSVLAQASAPSWGSVTWLRSQESAIVKLDTPGYPLWVMDKANAPMLYKDAEKFYFETDAPSAVLLNLTMSHDNKTLLINNKPVLPFTDYNVPPTIEAYQIPAEYTRSQVKGIIDMGLTKDWYWHDLTTAWRYLSLDYDLLVRADPYTGPYMSHYPVLRFRIMGLGAHSRSDVLDESKQQVLRVTLKDNNAGSSDDPKRSYSIMRIELVDFKNAYDSWTPKTEPEGNEKCSTSSWLCPDKGLYADASPPPYRFIWRSRFDEQGRIGSGRHALYHKIAVLGDIFTDAAPSMLLSFGILMSISVVILAIVGGVKIWKKRKENKIRDLADDDRLLGEEGEKYFDEDDEDEDDVPPPLPPRPSPKTEGVLIDLEAAEGA